MKIFDPKLTGSISFENAVQGNIEITGDLVVPGSITAREFKTEFVSASIIYQSGSTQFGNSSDDTHIFTGSAFIEPGLTVTGDGTNHIIKAVRAGSTRLFVGNAVNTVGINTETVNNPLTVNGGADFSGNVGIGVTTPTNALRVVAKPTQATTDGAVVIKNEMGNGYESLKLETDSGFDSALSFRSAGTNSYWWGMGIDNSDSGKFKMGADNLLSVNTKLTIEQGGNVGIGTTAPETTLHVNGATTMYMSPAPFWNLRLVDYQGGGGLYLGSVKAGGNMFIAADSYYNNSGFWQSRSTTSTAIDLYDNKVRFLLDSGLTADSNFLPTERMRINSDGNVGIGTTTPSDLLHLHKSSGDTRFVRSYLPEASTYNVGAYNTEGRVAAGLRFNWYTNYWQIGAARGDSTDIDGLVFSNNGNTYFVIAESGDVGIGTTSALLPSAGRGNLSVNGASDAVVTLGVNGSWSSYYYTNGSATFLASKSGTPIHLEAGGTTKVYIASGGNVGIGTSSPIAKLHVKDVEGAAIVYQGDKRGKMIGKTIQRHTISNPKADLFTITSYQSGNTNLFAVVTVLYVSPVSSNSGKGTASFFIDGSNTASPSISAFTFTERVGGGSIALEWDNAASILKFVADGAPFWFYVVDVEYVAFDGAGVVFNTSHSFDET